MEHSFIDKYSERDSFLRQLDPRTKIISFFAFIIIIVLTPAGKYAVFGQYALVVGALVILSRIPIKFIFKRILMVIPFILAVVIFMPFFKEGTILLTINLWLIEARITQEGLLVCWNVLAKSLLSVTLLTVLVSSTGFAVMLKGFEILRLPRVFIIIVSFMYRYLFLLLDEAGRMERAHSARWFGGHIVRQIKIIGNIIALLFIRSYERAERVYASMLARGFDGRIKSLSDLGFHLRDAVFVITLVILLAAVWSFNL